MCGRFARVWGGGGAGGPRGLVLGWGVGVVWGRARVCRAQAGRLASVGGLFLACACLCGRALRRILLERAFFFFLERRSAWRRRRGGRRGA